MQTFACVFLASAVAFLAAPSHALSPAAEADKVASLPGYSGSMTSFGFSGYLSAQGQKKLHYWFIPSQGDPSKDPVALWLNGGPGCSSMDGLLSEHGPFHLDDYGKTVYDNPYSWNKLASMLYLEAPAGVGFSYSPNSDDYKTNDETVANDNWHALQDFFTRVFPEYQSNVFGVTGESYGGVYVPSLTNVILQNNAKSRGVKINLQYMGVGNGLSSYRLNDNGAILVGYGHGIIGTELWSDLVTHCCAAGQIPSLAQCSFHNPQNSDCLRAVSEATILVYGSGLNMYRLNGLCRATAPPSSAAVEARPVATARGPSREFLARTHLFRNLPADVRMRANLGEDVPCVDSYAATTWLNSAPVRSALHIEPGLPAWSICSATVGSQYQRNFTDMTETYHSILALNPDINIALYNGNDDAACPGLGDEIFVKELGRSVVTPRKMFHVDGQVAGQVVQYDKVAYVNVKASGHMVPQGKPNRQYPMGVPPAALYIFENYILGNQNAE